MHALYSPFLIREDTGRIIEMSPESAELVKYAANAMLAQRISFINFLSRLSAKVGADIRDVRKGMGSDHRIGTHFLYPGPGFGGSCFPKDVAALAYQARLFDVEPLLLDATLQTNDAQREYIIHLVQEALGGKKIVGILGLAFKARTDDVRSSASIPLAQALLADGKKVLVHDPKATEAFLKEVPGVTVAELQEILSKADVVAIITEWDEYRTLSDDELKLLQGKTIVDCRNILARDVELEKMREYKIHYVGLGVTQ
jgi:UDPglucose 6-dehydrogenase